MKVWLLLMSCHVWHDTPVSENVCINIKSNMYIYSIVGCSDITYPMISNRLSASYMDSLTVEIKYTVIRR